MFSRDNPSEFYDLCLRKFEEREGPGAMEINVGGSCDVGQFRIRAVRTRRMSEPVTTIMTLRDRDERLYAKLLVEDKRMRWIPFFRDEGINMAAYLTLK